MAKENNEISTNLPMTPQDQIQSHIYTIRGVQVMLDRDLAVLYQVETKVLNQAVKRNINRFPDRFMFQLTSEEFENWKSQNVTSNLLTDEERKSFKMGLRRAPYVFTEQGVSQLSAVLHSDVAVEASIRIIDAFVALRKFVFNNASLFQRLESVELRQLETDKKIENLLCRLDDGSVKIKKGIFFDHQMFDALVLLEEIVKKAKHRILLIDDYVDARILDLFYTHAPQATVDVYVKPIHQTATMRQAFNIFHRQYPTVHYELHDFTASHDRWLFVDDTLYHFGASLKDLGTRWFCCSEIEEDMVKQRILAELNQ